MQQQIEHSSSPGAVEDELRFCPHCLDHQIRPSCFSCDGKKEKETFHSRKRPDDANSVCPLEPCKHEYSSKTSAIMLTLKMKNERYTVLCVLSCKRTGARKRNIAEREARNSPDAQRS